MSKLTTSDIAFQIATETAAAIATAKALVIDAEISATAKVRSQHFTNCRNCQAGLENFMTEYPDASDAAVQSYLEDVVFLDCKPCTDHFHEWIDEVHAETQARLDEVHAHNGDDLRWQNGGVK